MHFTEDKTMLVITNRNIDKSFLKTGIGNQHSFGEELNANGPNEIRLANATKLNGIWYLVFDFGCGA